LFGESFKGSEILGSRLHCVGSEYHALSTVVSLFTKGPDWTCVVDLDSISREGRRTIRYRHESRVKSSLPGSRKQVTTRSGERTGSDSMVLLMKLEGDRVPNLGSEVGRIEGKDTGSTDNDSVISTGWNHG